MNPTIINVIISLVIGMIIGVAVLRYFFKDSILFKIGLYWVTSLLIVMTNTAIASKFHDEYPLYISLPIGIAITVYLIYLTARTIKGPLANAINNLHTLSLGDLKVETKKTDESQKDELALIENSVSNLSNILNDVISKVKASSDQLNISSQHLNNSSQLLAQGSSEQASTTEELSSTIEEINSNIRQNAENSKVSVEIAESATIDLTQLLRISEKNHQSVNEIAQKIGVINDIAFQTNILALNAAVEASHAGESGKGFAVVASEVKKLAEKSKSAADSINALSLSSLDISKQTNELLKKLVPEIDKTVGFLRQITSANSEQNIGINQLNNAIQQLNQVTQQNAVSAEELAASSIELTNNAEDMAKSIEYFKIKGNDSKVSENLTAKPITKLAPEPKIKLKPEPEKIIKPDLKQSPKVKDFNEPKTSKGAFIDLKSNELNEDEFEKF
jgi:methyl-accepting chemotaxis protein